MNNDPAYYTELVRRREELVPGNRYKIVQPDEVNKPILKTFRGIDVEDPRFGIFNAGPDPSASTLFSLRHISIYKRRDPLKRRKHLLRAIDNAETAGLRGGKSRRRRIHRRRKSTRRHRKH